MTWCCSPRTGRASTGWWRAWCPGSCPPSTSGQAFSNQGSGVKCPPSSTRRCGGDSEAAFAAQRLMEAGCPLVNSEYYPGWLDHWCDFHQADS